MDNEGREQILFSLDLLRRIMLAVLFILCGYLLVVGMWDFVETGPAFHELSVADMIPDCVSRHYIAVMDLLMASIGFLAIMLFARPIKKQ